jgi:HEAT repeat protein
MNRAIYQLLGIQDKDSGKLAALGPIFFFTGIAYASCIISSQSLFVSKFGVAYLPLMYLVEAAVLPLQLWMINYLNRKMPRGKLIRGLFLIILTVLAVVALFAWCMTAFQLRWRGFYPLLFIICSVLIRILVPLMWMLGNGICLLQQAKRLFPILGALFTLGASCAGLLGRIAPVFFAGSATEAVLLVVPITLFFSLFLWRRIINHYFLTKDLEVEDKTGSSMKTVIGTVWGTPLLRLALLGCIIMMSLYYIVDYQFFIFSNRQYPTSDDLTRFYGMFVAILYFVTLLVNLLLNRLIKGVGIGKTLVLIGITAVAVLAGSGLTAQGSWPLQAFCVADLIIDVLAFTLLPILNEVFYKLIPLELRAGISLFFAGSINALGKLLSSVITGLYSIGMVPLIGLAIISVILALWYFLLTLRQKHSYFATLLGSLQHHIVSADEIEDFAVGKTLGKGDLVHLREALQSPDSTKQLIALELSAQIKNEALFPVIEPLLTHPDHQKRVLALQALPETLPGLEELCLRALRDEDAEIRCEAIRRLKRLFGEGPRLKGILEVLLTDSSPSVIRETIIGLCQNSAPDPDLQTRISKQIQTMLAGDDEHRYQACRAIGALKAPDYAERIREMVSEELSPRVRIAAVKYLGELGSREALPVLMKSYSNADWELKQSIERALLDMGENVADTLAGALDNGDIEGWYLRVTVLAGLDSAGRFEKIISRNCDAKIKNWRAANEVSGMLERAGMGELASLYRRRMTENFRTIMDACWKVLLIYYDPIVVKRLQQTFEPNRPADKREQGVEILSELVHKYPFATEMAYALQGEPPAAGQPSSFPETLKRTKREFSDYWLDIFADYAIAHYIDGGA